MLEKLKKFYKKHEVVVLTIGGGIVIVTAVVLLGKKIKSNNLQKVMKDLGYSYPADRALLESYGAVFKDGSTVPFATKEIVTKFMEERGETYQIEILDDSTSVIWISE